MANTLQSLPFDSPSSSTKSNEPFFSKLKCGLVKFINRRKHSSIVDTFRPNNKCHYKTTRQDSNLTDQDDQNDTDDDTTGHEDTDDDDNDNIQNKLRYSVYSKDDSFERNQYMKATGQHHRRPSTVSIQSPPSILVKRSPTPSSHHRHTSSLQNSSIISTPGSNSNRPAHYHHSRHYSHISCISASNMTVNSEDLTAKEFADMAGIKILSDDELDQDDPAATSTTGTAITGRSRHTSTYRPISSASSIVTTGYNHQHRPSYSSYHAGDETDWSVLSSGSIHSQQSGSAKIWDTGFWRRPSMDDGTNITTTTKQKVAIKTNQHQLPPLPTGTTAPTLRKHRSALLQHRQTLSLPPPIPPNIACKVQVHHAKSKSTCDLPIVRELRRMHSIPNNNGESLSSNNNDHPIIRKGRFEIQLESNCVSSQQHSTVVLDTNRNIDITS
ncbi:uncharacterized protein BX664DRAFT_331371 [Halteromyces radiatus]|uniref:uncharacterized protein n=1 Tax=Halteromyces radiatus TaxID=101107 RepID=UPI002221191E|nr:uncharacterized protein BX664DRAFT_331371 [Halteromyces radiatus]KAI8088786.1 hypothetical protein BX664DRAFT_331371 [Halteromyces radiatus]